MTQEADIRRLIAGTGEPDIVVYDVSDARLYGRKNRVRLSGALAAEAEAAGCVPEVFQAVYWLTLVGIPVWPFGTFLVMPRRICDDPDGDADQFRRLRIPADRVQIGWHFAIGAVVLAAFIWMCVATVRLMWMRAHGVE